MSGDRVVEHEIIEQLTREPDGRALDQVCELVRQHGRPHPLTVLREMWRAGYIALHDDRERPLLSWECADVWRSDDESRLIRVRASPHGLRWVRTNERG